MPGGTKVRSPLLIARICKFLSQLQHRSTLNTLLLTPFSSSLGRGWIQRWAQFIAYTFDIPHVVALGFAQLTSIYNRREQLNKQFFNRYRDGLSPFTVAGGVSESGGDRGWWTSSLLLWAERRIDGGVAYIVQRSRRGHVCQPKQEAGISFSKTR